MFLGSGFFSSFTTLYILDSPCLDLERVAEKSLLLGKFLSSYYVIHSKDICIICITIIAK